MKVLLLSFISLSAFFVMALSFANAKNHKALSASEIQQNIEQVLTVLDENYVYPKIASKMRVHVENKVSEGLYDQVPSLNTLIETLEDDLRETSKDGHISLHLVNGVSDRKTHTRAVSESSKQFYTDVMAGDKIIGFLKFNTFSNTVASKDAIIKAMTELASTDSLIIDLRDNGGGDPNLVAFLSSYFVKDNTLLWSVLNRQGETVIEVFSEAQSEKYLGNVCVLTSQKTYSAAEAFAYTLKHLGRACIVGEATGGGAHLVKMAQVNDKLDIRVPIARAYNPITKSNWEGSGVTPTINVDPGNAKAVAINYLLNIAE